MTAPAAALVNGTLSHALDYDDTHFDHIGHPSVVVLSALMAEGPQDWKAFEEAALIGMEASVRIGVWLGRDHYQRGFHQTATAGAFGACLGLIRLHGLTAPKARAALGLCASMASGLKAQFGTMGKPLNAGLAARAAVEATRWAAAGMTGPAEGLEAFAAAHDAACDEAALVDLGIDWRLDNLSHKFHACCHGLHATLEALRAANVTEMEAIDIETHPRWMSVCNQPDPDTGLGAKFSYRHVAAMAALGYPTDDIGSFTDEIAKDPIIATMRHSVTVHASGDLSETQARVRIKTPDGDVIATYDLADQVPVDQLTGRIRQKIGTLLGVERATQLWSAMQTREMPAFQTACFQIKRAPD